MHIGKRLTQLLLWVTIPVLIGASLTVVFVIQQGGMRAKVSQELQPAIAKVDSLREATDELALALQSVALQASPAMEEADLEDAQAAINAYPPAGVLDRYQELARVYGISEQRLEPVREELATYHTTATRLLAKVKGESASTDEAEDANLSKPLSDYVLELAAQRNGLHLQFDELSQPLQDEVTTLQAAAAQRIQWVFMIVSGTSLLAIVMTLLLVLRIRIAAVQPLRKVINRLSSPKPLPKFDGELGAVVEYINQTRQEQKDLEQTLSDMGEGAADDLINLSPERFDESMLIALQKVHTRLKGVQSNTEVTKKELAEREQAYLEKDKELITLRSEMALLQAKMEAVQTSLAIAELDAEGKLVTADDRFQELSGFGEAELKGKALLQYDGSHHSPAFFNELWETVKKGRTWFGVMQSPKKAGGEIWLASAITPLKHTNGSPSRYLLAGYEVSALKAKEQELNENLKRTQDELNRTREKIAGIQSQQKQTVDEFTEQKALENRLVQQQSALTELTRNIDLKEGNVREALRTITEATAFALQEERVSFWLFTENGGYLRCLDLYERSEKRHSHSQLLAKDDHEAYFLAIHAEQILATPQIAEADRTQSLALTYAKSAEVGALLGAPIKLGGEVVGLLQVEHKGERRQWMLDEQNFVLSVADIVSLALEQGNRKVMEEELRMTLEESQALEEELRQNAEEIEATNEEMRRTQVELRGQINALNNAAIVSETNLQGTITYANSEFARVYGHSREDIIGQNHRLVKADFHSEAFYAHMWETITGGKVWKGEVKNATKEGQDVWVLLTITPVLGVDGKPYKFIGVSFNITAQKRQELQIKNSLQGVLAQEEALRENAQLLESANEEMRRTQIELAGQINALNNSSMVFETDMEGNISYVNEELLQNTGYKEDDLIGHRYTILRATGSQADSIYQEQWRKVLKGDIWHGEMELKHKDGSPLWVVVTITPVLNENGEPIKSINVLVDITGQKAQEFRLKKQQGALLELTAHPSIKDGVWEDAFNAIVKIGRETLDVSRASIWLYDDENPSIVRCMSVEQEGKHTFATSATIEKNSYPIYFRTMERDRVIAADDAMRDPRTRELAQEVFEPLGVKAVLDTAIRMGGNIKGFISFEHRGAAREWTLDEQSFASSIADTIGLVLEQKERKVADKLRLAYNQLEDKNQEILRQKQEIEEQTVQMTHSIRYAKRIQQNILPAKELLEQKLGNYFIVWRPRDIVGGDFYWYSEKNGKHIIVIADGTGHGVPGAFLTLIGYLLLNQIVEQRGIIDPAQILYHIHIGVRTALKQDEDGSENRDGFEMAVVAYDPATKHAEFAGAGLDFYYYQDWELNRIRGDKKSIGGEQMEEERTFTKQNIELKNGDAFYIYTDGFVDQMGGPEEKRFSTKRFRDLVLRTQHESMATQRALINLEWKEWKDDGEQLDDVTVFGLKIE